MRQKKAKKGKKKKGDKPAKKTRLTKKVILVGYLDGQVDILCFNSKKTLFKTEPSQEGTVKGIFFTQKGDNAFLASFHVKEDKKEEQGFHGPEHYHIK